NFPTLVTTQVIRSVQPYRPLVAAANAAFNAAHAHAPSDIAALPRTFGQGAKLLRRRPTDTG
ncbi:unnamed protein product, partial [Ceratitis capitata]